MSSTDKFHRDDLLDFDTWSASGAKGQVQEGAEERRTNRVLETAHERHAEAALRLARIASCTQQPVRPPPKKENNAHIREPLREYTAQAAIPVLLFQPSLPHVHFCTPSLRRYLIQRQYVRTIGTSKGILKRPVAHL